jgi:hypothetical protein
MQVGGDGARAHKGPVNELSNETVYAQDLCPLSHQLN